MPRNAEHKQLRTSSVRLKSENLKPRKCFPSTMLSLDRRNIRTFTQRSAIADAHNHSRRIFPQSHSPEFNFFFHPHTLDFLAPTQIARKIFQRFACVFRKCEQTQPHTNTHTHTHNDGGIFRKTRRFFKRPGLVSGARSVFVDSFFISTTTTAHYRRVKHGLSFASKALMLIYRKSLFLRLNRSSPTT